MRVAAIDIGAGLTKAVLVDENGTILQKSALKTGASPVEAAAKALAKVLKPEGLTRETLEYVATTGYARYLVPFLDIQITELTSHARGVIALFPGTRTVIDIGAQSSRVMRTEPSGMVKAFRMNDKCGAGSGSFLERTAQYLEVSLEDTGAMALQSEDPQLISCVCAVLAETEIINQISEGKKVEDILMGAMLSLTSRIGTILRRIKAEPEVTLTGGLALNEGMVRAMEETLKQKINVDPSLCLYTGALGAALLGLTRYQKLAYQTPSRLLRSSGAL